MELKEFYKLLNQTKNVKQKILNHILKNKKVPQKQINSLKDSYHKLNNIEKENNKFILKYKNNKIKTRLNYELSELKKDLIYLEKGEDELIKYLSSIHKNFYKQKNQITKRLPKNKFDIFITDRDGTINNYSERYLSSIQSIYNTIFLLKFISKKTKDSIILTSASLDDFEKVNMIPIKLIKNNNLILSGSKGSEFYIRNKKIKISLSKKEKEIMEILEREIKKLISKKEYEVFSVTGSGFQKKHRQLTIAKQDVFNSINKKLEKVFFEEIKNIVMKIDKNSFYFNLNDTGTDIEITLKLNSREFEKSKGIDFIFERLNLSPKSFLVCGDTNSDLSFLKYKKSKNFNAIFVTKDSKLKNKIKNFFPKTIIVSSPDILITALNDLSKTK